MADVQIVLEAQDKASVVLEKVAKKVEDNVKQIRSTGEATKKSTELVGAFASALGDTGLGSYAGQLASLTEKVSAFSETMKDGAANSLAFKGGLQALSAVIGFSVGKAIGDAIFQTKKWGEELEAAAIKAKNMDSELVAVANKRFNFKLEEIELVGDPDEQTAALRKVLATAEKELADTNKQIDAVKNRVISMNEAWYATPDAIAAASDTSTLESNAEALRSQITILREKTDESRLGLEAQKEANAAQEKSASYIANLQQEIQLLKAKKDEVNAITAAQAVGATGDLDGAEALLNERDKLKAAQAHADEIKKLTADLEKQLDIERLGVDLAKQKEQLAIAANEKERATIEILQRQINQEKERTAAIKEAEKAAADAEKERLKAVEDRAKEEEAKAKALNEFQPGTQATESRLLTRGPADRGIDKIAKSTEDTVKELKEVKIAIRESGGTNNLQLEFVP